MSDSDHELMRRCRDGDAKAFEDLVRRWQGRVAKVLARFVGPAAPRSNAAFNSGEGLDARRERGGGAESRYPVRAADVDDLLQEVFLRVLGARGRYRPQGAFSTWLYRIVLNVARDAARRRRHRWWQPLGNHEPISPAAGPEEIAGQHDLCRQVEAALAVLPAKLREVLVLKHFGDMTFAEVARVTGLPASTVKSRVQSALEKLRAHLRRRGIDERELS